MVDSKIYFSKKRILGPLFFTILGACLLGFMFFGSLLLENKFSLKKEIFFYVPPLNYLKIISGSFQSFCADIFYIRGVLAITDSFQDRMAWIDWVQKNFEVATNLDPKLTQGYFFAGVVIAHGEEGIKKGIQFLEKGLKQNTKEWQIPYWIGFNYYQLQDYLKAIEYYEKASQSPGAPKFLKSIQPMYYYRAGRPDLGLIYLQGLLHSVKDPRELEWVETKLKWIENIVYLEDKLKQFKALYGHCPERIENLKEAGLLEEIPEDPFGGSYYLDKDTCRIKSKFSLSEKNLKAKSGDCNRCK